MKATFAPHTFRAHMFRPATLAGLGEDIITRGCVHAHASEKYSVAVSQQVKYECETHAADKWYARTHIESC